MAPPIKPQSQPVVAKEPEHHFTVFIRLPFPRGDFIDPPPIDWDSSKDRALWETSSRASKGSEIDWRALAEQFDVSLPFLLQQAAWLYERQLSQVRAQLRKVSKPASTGTSPTLGSIAGSTTAGGQAMKRGGSGGSRVPSALSVRARESPVLRSDGSTPSTPIQLKRPQASQNSSTNTVFQASKLIPAATRQSDPRNRNSKTSLEANRRTSEGPIPAKQISQEAMRESASSKADSSSSSSSPDSDTPAPMSRSRAFTRRPRFSAPKPKLGLLSDDDAEDDEDAPAFLPFSAAKPEIAEPAPDPSATLRQNTTKLQPPARPKKTHSSSSSASSVPHLSTQPSRSSSNALHTLSPRQRRIAKEGSEGTHSMGSSFSDLDDASVTQSALEEALAREMGQPGGGSSIGVGVAGRMSTISQALRSRYL
ncbi:hypothetical protein MMC06_000582 [Schaereria dolodes]|nr:hypothetical protein [Schaereria dolodes]